MPLGLLLWFLAGVWGSIVAHDKKPLRSGAEALGWIVLGPWGLVDAYLFRQRVCHRCGRVLFTKDYYCPACHQASLEHAGFEDDEYDEDDDIDSEEEPDERE